MEKMLQIIGAKEVANKIVEITCIPYTSTEVREKKKSMLSMAMQGINVSEMVQEIQGERQQFTKFYVTQDEWLNFFKNKMYSAIKVDISMFKEMPDRK
jgi:hypothetical protein